MRLMNWCRKSYTQRILTIICITLVAAIIRVSANETVTLTILEGARQEYKGFGVGIMEDWDWPYLPEPVKHEMTRFLHEEVKVNHIRVIYI